MIVVAAFSPALDTTYVLDELALGRPHRPTSVVRVAGGKALNMARAAHRLGAAVTAVPVLGGHLGDLVEHLLRDDGVDGLPVRTADETRVCVSVASTATSDLTEVYEHAVPVPDDAIDAVLRGLGAALRPGAWLSVSGGLPEGARPGLVRELAELTRASSARLALDTHGEPLRRLLAERTPIALLKVNRAEAAEALELPTDRPLADLVAGLRERTGGVVCVTDGVHGALAADDSGRWRAPLPTAAGAFPVGSGDSFLGALVAALDAGGDLPSALAEATGAAAANAEVPGAAVFAAERAREIAALVQVTRGD